MTRLSPLLALALLLSPRLVSAQEPPSGEAVYKLSCAQCHDQPTGRTPPREALRDRTADAILQSLTGGSMALQGVNLTIAERRAVSEFLSGTPFGAAASSSSTMCASTPATLAAFASTPKWNGWGVDASNSRFQKDAGLTAADVPNLKLKWAFGFPGGTQAYGHPVIAAGRIFVGSDGGLFYSLDAETGCTYWSFQAAGGIRTAPTIAPSRNGHTVYFGDVKAFLYAVDAASGTLVWTKQLDEHRFARVTGSPVLSDGRLFVPVSSLEEAPAAQPSYECCTFRGSVAALDAATGDEIWRTYMIPEKPSPVGKNSAGTTLYAPAGASVWNSPTIDATKGVLYVGTGNAYTSPAPKTTDSIVALDLKTGRMVWWNQLTPADTFLIGCRPENENCPKENGPDHDFGSSPILRTLPDGKRVLLAGQKSGVAWGLDPDDEGKVLWQFRASKGGMLGGIEWGSAADEENMYIPVSDVLSPAAEAGGLFAVKFATGEQVWHAPAPKLECNSGRGCSGAQSAPATVIPGVVFSGSIDGHLRAYSTEDGRILWDFNTAKEFETVNHVPAKGGSIDAAGTAIAGGLVVTNSGYGFFRGAPGNVLLVFSK